MTERDKIIEIIAPFVSAYGEDEAIADALIAANIGDVTAYKTEAEYWEKICKLECDEHDTKTKAAAKYMRRLMQERDEYKHRAEVAESKIRDRALNDACYAVAGIYNSNDSKVVVGEEIRENYIQQAKCEIEEEG